jgi:hypothetical protein
MTKEKTHAMEFGGRGGFSAEEVLNIFTGPECDEAHAFPGRKPGEPLMCPKCAIPKTSNYVVEEE